MSYLCPFCDHGQFFKGQHSPKDPCTAYVDKLGAECGCVGQARGPLKTGLDDGPPLPSEAARERAYARIEAMQIPTDADRINWLESVKYGRFGIGYNGLRYQVRIDLAGREYFGRTFREAIDAGIKAEPQGIVKAELRRAPTEEGGVVYTDDEPITAT